MIEKLWGVQDVSVYLGVPVATLYQWRYLGYGPKSRRVGRYVRYEPAVLAAIYKAALRDRLVGTSPCEGTKLPRKLPAEVIPSRPQPSRPSSTPYRSATARRSSWPPERD